TSASTGTFADERTNHPTYWHAVSSYVNSKGQWQTATAYNINDFVFDGYRFGAATTAFVSDVSYDADVLAGNIITLVDCTQVVTDATSAKNDAVSAKND